MRAVPPAARRRVRATRVSPILAPPAPACFTRPRSAPRTPYPGFCARVRRGRVLKLVYYPFFSMHKIP